MGDGTVWERLVRKEQGAAARFVAIRSSDGWVDVWTGVVGRVGGVKSREVDDGNAERKRELQKYRTKGYAAFESAEALVASLPDLNARERARALETLSVAEPPRAKLAKARASGSVRVRLSKTLMSQTLNKSVQVKRVAALLNAGADPNYADGEDSVLQSFVWRVIDEGESASFDCLDLLAEAGLRANDPIDSFGSSIVSILMGECEPASECELRLRLLHWLLDHGADVNRSCTDGITPLHAWASQGPTDKEFFRVMVASGADVHATDGQGQTPLHAALVDAKGSAKAMHERREARALWLIEAGARVDTPCADGRSPREMVKHQRRLGFPWKALEQAFELVPDPAGEGDWDEFVNVLNQLRRPDAVRSMPTNLSDAVAHGDLELVERFLRDGVDPDVGWRERFYPMERALAQKNDAMVKLLRRYGAR
ncbi:MAG: ankyrin repeat domain-containing protein, partial [Myxococcota bacterium]